MTSASESSFHAGGGERGKVPGHVRSDTEEKADSDHVEITLNHTHSAYARFRNGSGFQRCDVPFALSAAAAASKFGMCIARQQLTITGLKMGADEPLELLQVTGVPDQQVLCDGIKLVSSSIAPRSRRS